MHEQKDESFSVESKINQKQKKEAFGWNICFICIQSTVKTLNTGTINLELLDRKETKKTQTNFTKWN